MSISRWYILEAQREMSIYYFQGVWGGVSASVLTLVEKG